MPYSPDKLFLELLSDAAFAGGGGSALVDVDVERDELGVPRVGGKRIRALLRDAWLSMQDAITGHLPDGPPLRAAAMDLCGPTGDLDERSMLRIGDATLAPDAMPWIRNAVERKDRPLAPNVVLASLTSIRHQTAENRASGAPERATLRSLRVIRKGTTFEAPLTWLRTPSPAVLRVLALALLGCRHAGLHRNRGLGFVRLTINTNPNQKDDSRARFAATKRLAEGGTPC